MNQTLGCEPRPKDEPQAYSSLCSLERDAIFTQMNEFVKQGILERVKALALTPTAASNLVTEGLDAELVMLF